MSIPDKPQKNNLNNFGQKIRALRSKQNMLLRQVAAHIDADTALVSKVERGERNLTRTQVIKLASLFHTEEEGLISLWLCDKTITILDDVPFAIQGLKKAL